MSSVTDNGPDGLTRLAEIFRSLGARTAWICLRDRLPPDARVIVLVRPRRALNSEDLARVWQQVGAGNSLLVALDPQGYQATSTENSGSGLDRLITSDQGVSLLNGILIEPWFTNNSLRELFSTFSLGYADPVPHPITDPLRRYDLPLALWGARPVGAEPFGVNSFAWALVDALPEYVETSSKIFPGRNTDGDPFVMDLNGDRLGIVSVAAAGENTEYGSRVGILGDAELVQNSYGLALSDGNSGTPVYPADYILTQRLAAWLLRLPVDQYPALPSGLTWIALDGDVSDWPTNAPITTDDPNDASILSLNVQQVRALRNNSYLYMTVETVSQANADAQVDLELDANGDGTVDTYVSMQPGRVFAQQGDQDAVLVPDAAMGIGDVIELRLPLRLTGLTPSVSSLCLSSSRVLAFPQPPDCVDNAIQIGRISQPDPAPLRFTPDTLVVVRGDGHNRVNLRRSPSTDAGVLTTIGYGTPYAAVGRTANSQWVQVENAGYSGWLAAETLFTGADLSSLPVTG